MKKFFFITTIIIIFGCSNESAKNQSQNLISLFVITEDLEVGNNRVVLSVLDDQGQTITENLRFSLKKLGSNKITKIEPITVVSPSGPYIVVADYSTTTYDDNVVEYGEEGTLSVTLENIGI